MVHVSTSDDEYDSYQFGFKKGHSTALCTNVVKRTVDYYTSRGSHVFLCFVDFSKAFDKVIHWKYLFCKLLDDNVDTDIVQLLAYSFSHQQVCVCWHSTLSDRFSDGNGTRQGCPVTYLVCKIHQGPLKCH